MTTVPQSYHVRWALMSMVLALLCNSRQSSRPAEGMDERAGFQIWK